MQIDKRLAAVFAFLCLFAFITASCIQKNIKPGKVSKPHAEQRASRPVGKSPERAEAFPEEEKRIVETQVGPSSVTVMKNDIINSKLRNEIRSLELVPIYFDFDKSNLTPEAQAALVQLARWLKANPRYCVLIEGHSDERGSEEYNLALGETRATAADKYLQMLGIEPDRISTVSYGEEKPAVIGKDESSWAKNRRDEFKLIRKP